MADDRVTIHTSDYAVAAHSFDVDCENFTADQVRAVLKIILPFRLRVGDSLEIKVSEDIAVWLLNHYSIPHGTTHEDLFRTLPQWNQTFTTAMIVVKPKPLSSEHMQALKESLKTGKGGPTAHGCIHDAHVALNEVVVGYHMVTGQVWGGTPVHRMSDWEFISRLVYQTMVVIPKGSAIDDDRMRHISQSATSHIVDDVGQFTGNLDDIVPLSANAIEAAIHRERQFIFYELMFEAKCNVVRRSFNDGLLYSVMALEAAHATFLLIALSAALTDADADAVEKFVDTALMKQGFKEVNGATPYLLMPASERPAPEVIKGAEKAVEMRNAMMHSLRKKGQYKSRRYTSSDILTAYKAAIELSECYVTAIEARVGVPPLSVSGRP